MLTSSIKNIKIGNENMTERCYQYTRVYIKPDGTESTYTQKIKYTFKPKLKKLLIQAEDMDRLITRLRKIINKNQTFKIRNMENFLENDLKSRYQTKENNTFERLLYAWLDIETENHKHAILEYFAENPILLNDLNVLEPLLYEQVIQMCYDKGIKISDYHVRR